jgi:hypothetical protein
MAGSAGLIVLMPVIMHGLITCANIHQEGLASPYNKIMISPVKNFLDKINADKQDYLKTKSDIEVYTGVYLIVGIFFGMSSFIGVLLYWQVLRVRCMINP